MNTLANYFTILCALMMHTTATAQDEWNTPDPASHPSFSFVEGMATLGGDKVLEFGAYGETWVYDLSDNTWTSMIPTSSPTGRVAHVMANMGGDKVLLFGGTDDYENFIPNNETWIYDLSDNEWTFFMPPTSPAARTSTAIAYAGGDHAVLYGGDPGISETWMYDLGDNTWTIMNPVSNPGGQVSHAMAFLDDDRILLFSGVAGFDQTWVYDLSDNSWTQMSASPEPPSRALSAMASLGGDRVLLYGGFLFEEGDENETWIYDYGDNTWASLSLDPNPGGRQQHAMASITIDHVLLFGGQYPDMTTFLFTASPEPCPAEQCNEIDDDCDGLIDEGVKTTYFLDNDNDGFGNPNSSILACEQPEGYVGTGTDCNDTLHQVHPDAVELPDGLDNDCDGLIDEGLSVMNVEAGDCEVVYLGYAPSQCLTLNVYVTGGTTPYSYLWNNEATTQNTTVCPTSTTLYTVTVTDANGSTAVDMITVQVIDIRCGNNNDKVVVCHIPPSNPENIQIICIAPSAVQAHLDHGCYIGICDAHDPCNDEFEAVVTSPVIHELIMEESMHTLSESETRSEDINSEVLPVFTLFPNPADQEITIHLTELNKVLGMQLYDLSGKMVLYIKEIKDHQTLSTVALHNGVYFLSLKTMAGLITKRVVILH